MTKRIGSALVALALAASACTASADDPPSDTATSTRVPAPVVEGVAIAPVESAQLRNQAGYEFPPPPEVPTGEPAPEVVEALDVIFGSYAAGIEPSRDPFDVLLASGDLRIGWLVSDLLRFIGSSRARNSAIEVFEVLSGANLYDDPVSDRSLWRSLTDHLIAWDVAALPDYLRWKGQLFLLIEPRWEPFFNDADAEIDWRLLSWGGVLIDDRPLGTTSPCIGGCIPALDDPAVTDAGGGSWYADDAVVFGVTVNGESRAYPKNIMEVHEMVNDTIGGRRLGIPYCTLCGSAQAYFTDNVEGGDQPVLRTSGLLTRSNKVMYDLTTWSVIDTFTGRAVSGDLLDRGVVLDQVSVVTSTWGDWKRANPDTTIVAEDGGIGRSYATDPLRGRDDAGPIFPIGNVDERLPVQEKVLGVLAMDGTPIAFPVASSRASIDGGGSVALMGVELRPAGSGVRAIYADGSDAAGHEAFWFAWSQFYPDTVVWSAPSG